MADMDEIEAGRAQVQAAYSSVQQAGAELALLAADWRSLAAEVSWESPAARQFTATTHEAADRVVTVMYASEDYAGELSRAVSLVAGVGGCG